MYPSLSTNIVRSDISHVLIHTKNFNIDTLRDDVSEQIDEVLENRVTKKVRASWKDFTTIEKWKTHFDKHPEWYGQSTGRIKDIGIDTNNLFPYNFDDLVKDMLKINVVRDHH